MSSFPPGATRERLLRAAIAIFAERGYHHASTREICRVAGANSAAIHYHFGDKANLYREVFRFGLDGSAGEALPAGEPSRHATLARFYRVLLAPLAGSPLHQQVVRLHAREEVEPSGVLGDTVSAAVRPRHARLTAYLVHELGLARSDLEVERLAFALVGVGGMFYHLRHLIADLEPRLISGPAWLDTMAERLAGYAVALIDGEIARRARATKEAAA